MIDLSVKIAGIKMKNPIMPASGTFAYGKEMADFIDISKLGAVVSKNKTARYFTSRYFFTSYYLLFADYIFGSNLQGFLCHNKLPQQE